MEITIRHYREEDLPAMTAIWNEVVEEGVAFPQTEPLTAEEARAFFAEQSGCRVAEDSVSGKVLGLSILHPNNIGRCGHIANASFAVAAGSRSLHLGEKLVRDCLQQARELGFRLMQFNAVAESNVRARHLYQRLGFQELGVIPGGFRRKDGVYEDIHLYYFIL